MLALGLISAPGLHVVQQRKQRQFLSSAENLSALKRGALEKSPQPHRATFRRPTVVSAQQATVASKTGPPAVKSFDFLVLGSGIAGLSYALKVASYGSVAVVGPCPNKVCTVTADRTHKSHSCSGFILGAITGCTCRSPRSMQRRGAHSTHRVGSRLSLQSWTAMRHTSTTLWWLVTS